jgi:hypothetical protein
MEFAEVGIDIAGLIASFLAFDDMVDVFCFRLSCKLFNVAVARLEQGEKFWRDHQEETALDRWYPKNKDVPFSFWEPSARFEVYREVAADVPCSIMKVLLIRHDWLVMHKERKGGDARLQRCRSLPYLNRLNCALQEAQPQVDFGTESIRRYLPFVSGQTEDLEPNTWNDMEKVEFAKRVVCARTDRVFSEDNFNCILKENNVWFERFVATDENRDGRFRIRGVALGEGLCYPCPVFVVWKMKKNNAVVGLFTNACWS